jgi:hypothetical protein
MADNLKLLTAVDNEPDAAILAGRLRDAGIHCILRPPLNALGWSAWAKRAIYVLEGELGRALAVLQDDRGSYDEQELARLSEQAGDKATERARGEADSERAEPGGVEPPTGEGN